MLLNNVNLLVALCMYKYTNENVFLMKIYAHKYKCILNLMHPNEYYTLTFILQSILLQQKHGSNFFLVSLIIYKNSKNKF